MSAREGLLSESVMSRTEELLNRSQELPELREAPTKTSLVGWCVLLISVVSYSTVAVFPLLWTTRHVFLISVWRYSLNFIFSTPLLIGVILYDPK